MSNYYRIKEQELKTTESFSKSKFDWYLRAHVALRYLFSELTFWTVSLLAMMIFPIFIGGDLNVYFLFFFCHFLFWLVYGQHQYHRDCDKDVEEIELTIQVLKDIRKEKFTQQN